MTLTELCKEMNNYFVNDIKFDVFTIERGKLTLDFLQNGQYFRIVGSVFNDGVYEYPATNLTDEIFDGAVWAMAVPSAVIALCEGITDWENKYGDIIESPYSSESFGGYSYTKANANAGSNGVNTVDWRSNFAGQINKWRKIRP